MTRRMWISGMAIALVALIVAGLFCVAQAQESVRADEAGRRGVLQGKVVDVGDDSLFVETRDGTVEVLVTEDTTFRIAGKPQADLADIEVGAEVLIRPQRDLDEDDAFIAQAIVVRPARRLQDRVVRGTVTDAEEDKVSVEMDDEQLASLLITEATRLWVPGKPPTATVELAAGDPVLAFGDPVPGDAGTKVLSARLIVVTSDEDLPKILVQGRVLAVTKQTIVVQTGRGERAITVRPRTRLQTAGGRLESTRGLQQGQQIIALGQPTEYGQWMAGLVYLPGPAPLARNGLQGEVIAKDAEAGTLRVATRQPGEITVVTNEQTRYRIEGIEVASFDDIEVGNQVVVVGRFDKEDPDTFLAKAIGVIVRPAEATGAGEDQS